MSNNNFQWTDELVKEFAVSYEKIQGKVPAHLWGRDLLEEFKKSKANKEEPLPIKVQKMYFECSSHNTKDYVLEMNQSIPA